MAFREAWLKLENRKYVVGKASLNGNVTYHYDPTRLFSMKYSERTKGGRCSSIVLL